MRTSRLVVGTASATPEEGRRTFVLDEVACSAARDRQLSRAVRSLLPALALGAVFVATTGAKKSVAEPATPVVA